MKKKDIEVMLGAFLETVKEEVLDAGNEIRVRDFGTFKQKIGGMLQRYNVFIKVAASYLFFVVLSLISCEI